MYPICSHETTSLLHTNFRFRLAISEHIPRRLHSRTLRPHTIINAVLRLVLVHRFLHTREPQAHQISGQTHRNLPDPPRAYRQPYSVACMAARVAASTVCTRTSYFAEPQSKRQWMWKKDMASCRAWRLASRSPMLDWYSGISATALKAKRSVVWTCTVVFMKAYS
jgi:hypothetical protein